MTQLINDNIPAILREAGQDVKTRPAVDVKEFFQLLKAKFKTDIERVFNEKDIANKMDALADMMINMNELTYRISKYSGLNFTHHMEKRMDKIGGLDKQTVIYESNKEENQNIIGKILKYGKENNYPPVELLRNKEGVPYKHIGQGEQAWMTAIGWAQLRSPHDENFKDFSDAVMNMMQSGD